MVTAEESLTLAPAAENWRVRETIAQVGYYGVLCAAALVPPVVGATTATNIPAEINYAQGMPGSTELITGTGAYVSLGAAGGLYFPDRSLNVPGLGKTSARININSIELPDQRSGNSLSLYAAILTDPGKYLGRPSAELLEERLLVGGSAGIGLDIAMAGAMARRDRRRKRETAALEKAHQTLTEQEAELRKLGPVRYDHVATRRELRQAITANRSGRHRLVRTAAALSLIVGGIGSLEYLTNPSDARAAVADCQPFSPTITNELPMLKEAEACGSGIQAAAGKVVEYMSKADTVIDNKLVPHLKKLFAHLPTEDMAYINNPNYTVGIVISDAHCDTPMMTKLLPLMVEKFQPDLILNAGDVGISRDKFPLDAYCAQGYTAALTPTAAAPKNVVMVEEPGNHDSSALIDRLESLIVTGQDGKPHKPVVALDKDHHFQATVAGVTIVGSPDPRRSVWGHPLEPGDINQQDALLTAQGNQLRDIACDITKKTGWRPVLMPHDGAAANAAIAAGCTSLAISGHLHHQAEPKTYLDDNGDKVTVFVQGTSSGVGECGLTIYDPPKNDAPFTMAIYDRLTGQPVGSINLVAHPDGSWSYTGFKAFNGRSSVPQTVYDYVDQSQQPGLHHLTPGVNACAKP